MPRSLSIALATAALLTTGCLDVSDALSRTLNLDFNNNDHAFGWNVGIADIPVGREVEVAAVGDQRALPAPLVGNALYQTGTNVSGDLFVFQKKYLLGFVPGEVWTVSLKVEFVSNLHSGCTTGAGPAVVIKAGVSGIEPLASPDAQSIYRMNLDKGTGPARGVFAQLGDISNGLTGCPGSGTYAFRVTSLIRQTETVTIDPDGGLWIFLATQSSFSGPHEIWITQLQFVLRPA